MKLQYLFFISLSCFLLIRCNSKVQKDFSGLDLMKYGFPITLKAPENATVSKGRTGRISDISVKSDPDYNVHIFMSDAETTDISKIRMQQKEDVIGNPYFIKMIEEFDDGFIFEKESVKGYGKCYDFRYIKIQGNQEFIYQTAIVGEFTEKQVKTMYESVR